MKKTLLLLFLFITTGMYADNFKITASDPAAGECTGIEKGSYWKFSSNMDADPTFKAIKYEFYDATTQSSLYNTIATKSSKYVSAIGMWEIKNYATSISDFKKGHTIYLKITALDNESPGLANEIGKDSVTYIGAGSEEYVYSPTTVSISPVTGTELQSKNDNTFTLTFSQPVRLNKNETVIVTGQMQTSSFESITTSEDSTVWTLVAKSSTIESISPQLYINVYGTDREGLTFEGNTSGAYRLGDKSYYKFKYQCYLGSPSMTVTPAAGQVTSLKDFKLAYTSGINYSYAADIDSITIINEKGVTVATVSAKQDDGALKFDDDNKYCTFSIKSAITDKGKYTLDIPSKLFSLGTEFEGYTSKHQTAVYTIETEELSATISPSDDTELETMPNISVAFSNPSVVGYANYVITDLNPKDPENPIIMSGDLKKQSDGTWVTKYLSMYEIKLYAGHKYEIRINAYADEMDYNYGNDPMAQFTSVVKGKAGEYQYSDVTIVSFTPEQYSEITTGTFNVNFSGNIPSLRAEVNGGLSGSTPCEVIPADNNNKTWGIVIPESVISKANGAISINIAAKDANGLYVMGNMGADPDTVTVVTYNCYQGAPDFIISPADGSKVTQIDVITCSYDGMINPAWSIAPGYIMKGEDEVCTFTSSDVTVNDEHTVATVTLQKPITQSGTYQVVFPATFFTLGEEYDSYSSKRQTVTYTIESRPSAGNDFGELALGQNYTLKVFTDNAATFTAEADGVLTYSSSNTDEMRPYTTSDYTTEVPQFNRTGAAGGYSGQHTYDINVTVGTTYYFYIKFPMNASTFHIDMAGEANVECTSAYPEIGGKYNITNGGGQVSFSFNKPVIYNSATLKIADGVEHEISFRTTSNSLFTNDVQSLVWQAMNEGSAFEGDTMVITLTGVALQNDESVKFNGDGVFVAKYTLDRKPITVVSTENFTSGDEFLSFYTTNNEKGVVRLQFNGKVLGGDVLTASLRYGNLDQSEEGEYYYEEITPTLSEDSTSVLISLQGVRRRPSDMLPEATSGTEYDTISLHVSGVKDQYGNYAYSSGQGSIGSYDCVYNYKVVIADIAVEFTPVSGSDIANVKALEVWIDDEAKLSYDGILFTYKDSKLSTSSTELVTDIQKTIDPECQSAKILTIPVPQSVIGSDDITVTFQNLQAVDGNDYSAYLTAKYTATEERPSEVVRGDANGDSGVTMADVMYIINYILNQSATDFNLEGADANLDGKITMSDVMYDVNYILTGYFPSQYVNVQAFERYFIEKFVNQ